MRKIGIFLLIFCLSLSAVVFAQDEVSSQTENRQPFSREQRTLPQGFPGGEMPQFNGEMPRFNGEMPQFNGEMPDFGGQRPNFGDRMPQDTETKPAPSQAQTGEKSPDSTTPSPSATPLPPENAEDKTPQEFARPEGGKHPFGEGGMPGDSWQFGAGSQAQQQPESKGVMELFQEYFTPVVSLVLLGLAFLFVIFYRRKRY